MARKLLYEPRIKASEKDEVFSLGIRYSASITEGEQCLIRFHLREATSCTQCSSESVGPMMTTPITLVDTNPTKSLCNCIVLLVLISGMAICFGCREQQISIGGPSFNAEKRVADSAKGGAQEEPYYLELGILGLEVNAGHCISLKKLGIADTESIHSIKSSCECVDAQVILFQDRSGPARGLQVRVRTDDADLFERPVAVEAQLNLLLERGATRLIKVSFLETQLVSR